MSQDTEIRSTLTFYKVARRSEFPAWTSRAAVARFFHETMVPFHDTLDDVQRALDYAFSESPGMGGFVMLGRLDDRLACALLMLNTGMQGYVPENILLMVATDPDLRGRGLGRQIIERSLAECTGDVKLHVEHDNPARRLYERVGFTSKYLEMRLKR